MWKPFEPDVFTKDGSPSSASRSRTASAAARSGSGRRPDGSRSKTHRSGWYSFGTREHQTCGVIEFWLASQTSERASFASG